MTSADSLAAVISIDHSFSSGMYVEAAYQDVASTPVTGPLVVPRTGGVLADAYGPYGSVTSAMSYTLSSSGFTFDFNQYIPQQIPFGFPGDPGGPPFPAPDPIPGSGLAVVDLAFTTDTPVSYVLSGFYTASGFDAPVMQLVVELCDNTGGTICGYYPELFRNAQTSSSTPNESFTLGGLGGDDAGYPNLVDGSLTGTLFPGDIYSIHLYAVMGNRFGQTQFMTATGQLKLTFVPEPAVAALVLAGLLGLAAMRRPTSH